MAVLPDPDAITVVMPSYNRAHTIERALRSAIAQTRPPAQVIVVDDASGDDTVAVARRLGATVIETNVNQGSGPARNRGVSEARSPWIAFLDSDDEWEPGHLETLTSAADDHVLVATAGLTSSGRVVGNPTTTPVLLTPRNVLGTSELVVTSCAMARRDDLLATGGFRSLRRAQDLDMWVRVLEYGTGVSLPERTVTYYEHDQQASLDTDVMLGCFTDIVEQCRTRPWFDPGHDHDRAFARIHWDQLREAQRHRRIGAAGNEAWWIARRPHTWSGLIELLRLRGSRRHATRTLADAASTPAPVGR